MLNISQVLRITWENIFFFLFNQGRTCAKPQRAKANVTWFPDLQIVTNNMGDTYTKLVLTINCDVYIALYIVSI